MELITLKKKYSLSGGNALKTRNTQSRLRSNLQLPAAPIIQELKFRRS